MKSGTTRKLLTCTIATLSILLGINVNTSEVKAAEQDKKEVHLVKTANMTATSTNELEERYVESLFYGKTTKSKQLTQLNSNDSDNKKKSSAYKSKLNNTEIKIYEAIKEKLVKIASGAETNAEFAIDTTNYNDYKELMCTAPSGKVFTDESAEEAILKKFRSKINLANIWKVLLNDMPYELYWHDKTIGFYGDVCYEVSADRRSAYVTDIIVGFAVNKKYSATNEYGTYKIADSTAKQMQIAHKASETAKKIVKDNKNKTDLEKLQAYRKKICSLVDYNVDAMENSDTSGVDGIDPWSLVYVFDDDKSTNVVCEGYSKAFQYLCDLTTFKSDKIACYTVTGEFKYEGDNSSTGHMWNIVTMDDGKNYLVDLTNCDSGCIEDSDILFLVTLPGSASKGYAYSETFICNGYLCYDKYKYVYNDSIKELYGTGKNSILTLKSVKEYQKYNKKESTSVADNGKKTTITNYNKDRKISSVIDKISYDTFNKWKNVLITLKKDETGKLLSSTVKADIPYENNKICFDNKTLNKLKDIAGSNVVVNATVKDSKGNKLYSVSTSSNNLKANKTVKAYKYSSNSGYTIVNNTSYKLSESCNLKAQLKNGVVYHLVDKDEAKKVDNKIIASVKPKNKAIKIKKNAKKKIELHSKSNISKVVYSSSNNKVTKVSNKGTITAVNKGKATINMKVTLKNKKTKNIKVKVTV